MSDYFDFQLLAHDPNSRARAGIIHTAHGDVATPGFMPVATQASVKGLTSEDLIELGVQIVITNTYHLALRPGAAQIAELGGLHSFMNWPRVISTDSGGFQAFSLGTAIRDGVGKIADIFPDEAVVAKPIKKEQVRVPLVQIGEGGVTFSSHLDGSLIQLTPESSIETQHKLGADFILALDECTSPLDTYEYTREALERTHRWAVRCLEQHSRTRRSYQALFGIVQGGAYRDLREASAAYIGLLPFDGLAIGGSLGRSKQDMHAILEWTIPLLPENKPRHLLGIGELDDLTECVRRGVDLFDCAAPTRWARNGALIVSSETATNEGFDSLRLTISNARFGPDPKPVDSTCYCFTCRNYSRAYLHHLHRARELSYYRLASIHNLHMTLEIMRGLRDSILQASSPLARG